MRNFGGGSHSKRVAERPRNSPRGPVPPDERPVTDASPPITGYDAARVPRGLVRHVGPVLGYPGTLWRHRGLIWNFFRRELLARFRGSMIGVGWVLIQPIYLFVLYYLVFGFLFSQAPRTGADVDARFAVFLFTGILVWSSFQEGALRSCTVVVDNGNLVKKVAFPCELLPMHTTLGAMVGYLVGVVVVMAIGIPIGVVQPGAGLLAWPLVLVVHVTFTLGLGLLLANVYVFMRDANHIFNLLAQAWFFASPVFWQPDFLAEKVPGLYHILRWNPMAALLELHRQSLGVPTLSVHETPLLHNLGITALWAVVLLVLGFAAFTSRRHKFADLV